MRLGRSLMHQPFFSLVGASLSVFVAGCASSPATVVSWPSFGDDERLTKALEVSKRRCEADMTLGVNYPWLHFGADFGGLKAWSQGGVAREIDRHRERLKVAASVGAKAIRWWIFPDLRGDGVTFDARGELVGVSPTALNDVAASLDLLDELGLDAQLCVFSFDGFRPDRTEASVRIRSLAPYVAEAPKRAALIGKVIAPLVETVASHRHARRVTTWEIINEPEWAIEGVVDGSPEPTRPMADLTHVSHTAMKAFIQEAAAAIRRRVQTPVAIGVARERWSDWWADTSVDELSVHLYEGPTFDRGARPRVTSVGEIPIRGATGVHFVSDARRARTEGVRRLFAWRLESLEPAQVDEMRNALGAVCDGLL
ncbi:MAG: hypothetical protein U0165_19505 [Polyangiaceae bacterium]